MPMTILGRQPRAVRPPTTAPDRAPAMRPTTIQPRRPRSGTLRVSHGGTLRMAGRLAEERFDHLDQGVGMGVMGSVPCTRDDRHDAVREPVVEGGRRVRELRLAVAPEDLKHRLPDLSKSIEASGERAALGEELARDRLRRADP